MSTQSHTYNAYESQLDGPLSAGATSVALVSALGLEAPVYLVIDPDVPAKREWIRVTAININTIDAMDRGLEGSNGPAGTGVDHDSGAVIRAIFTSQLQDDLFFDINALETWDTDHVADSNPHPVYLTQGEGDAQYIQLDGGNAPTADIPWGTNRITSLADAQADGDAVNRGQVLAADAGHVAAADPHVVYLKLLGGQMAGEIDMGNFKITSVGAPTLNGDAATKQYVDDEIGGLPIAFDGDHASLTNVTADQHHVKYLDSDAVLAIQNSGLYYSIAESEAAFFSSGEDIDPNSIDVAFGTAVNPTYGFLGANQLGMYAAQTAILGFSAGGVETMIVGQAVVRAGAIYNQQAGTGANVFVDNTGQLFRITSARKYKSNIVDAPELADLVLNPVTFRHNAASNDQIGFIADDLAVQDERIGVFEEGEVESYSTNAVLAILAAKVNRLEGA